MNFRHAAIILALVVLTELAGCTRAVKSPEVKPVYVTQIAPPNMLPQLRAGEIDGFVAWEPFNAEAVLKGEGEYLARSGDIWKGHPCCVLALSSRYTDREATRALVWAHVKASRFLTNPANREKVLAYLMDFTGSSREVVEEALRNTPFVEYPDEKVFREYYQRLKAGGLIKLGWSDLGYSSEDQFFSDFFLRSYYDEVVAKLQADPHWAPPAVPASNRVRIGYIDRDIHQVQVYVAQREGFYQQVGLVPGKNLDVKIYSNGVAVMEGFKARELEVAYLGGAPATLKRVNDDIPIKILGGANIEGSAIVVRKGAGIRTVRDLAGRTIAVPGIGTVQYYLLEKAVSSENLKLQLK